MWEIEGSRYFTSGDPQEHTCQRWAQEHVQHGIVELNELKCDRYYIRIMLLPH